MLKHTGPTITNAVPTPAGQLRSSNASARGIHLRPQQPLNIATLNASTLQTSTAANTTGNATNITNGGQRIPTLLNIAPGTVGATTAVGVTGGATSTTNTTIPNGISPNLHTYSNQHVMAGNTSLNHNLQHNYSNCNNLTGGLSLLSHLQHHKHHGPGPREALTSLGLLCLGKHICTRI